MPRIAVPPDADPMMSVWSSGTKVINAAARFSSAAYSSTVFTLREFEAARARIAQINDCAVCLAWRTAPGQRGDDEVERVPEEFYAHVGVDPEWEGFSERERMAAAYAERFATDHLSLDDAFWSRMHAAFTDDEIVELTLCIGAWMSFGRLARVLDLDGACRVPPPVGVQ